jgi:cytochrome c5
MADQQDNASNFVIMLAGIALAVLLVVIVAFALLKGDAPPAPDDNVDDAEVVARIQPVATFERRAADADKPASPPEDAATEGAATEGAAQTGEADEADASATPGAGRDAAAIYASLCHTCHDLGVAGAPKKGDKAAWAPRIAAGMESLYHSAINGKGAMPPKGGQVNLTEDEIRAAVDYLVSLAQ